MIEKSKYDDFAMTQQEVADALGIERSYVGSIETRAKAKLKIELEKRGYRLEDFIGGMA
jgi:DNA-directed RNA polymerase specialized sigma subunit